MLSDLRECGGLEQDADLVMMLYRDIVYNKESLERDVAEIGIVKQRSGPIGMVKMLFDGKHTRFLNINGVTPGIVESSSKIALPPC